MKYFAVLFIALSASTCLIAQTAIAPAVGDGSEVNPYQIATLENLYWIAADNDVVPNPNQAARWSSHYIQSADIDASETSKWFDGEGWSPIGIHIEENHPENLPFSGSYNGQNHSIDSLFIDQPDTDYLGFFGYIHGATIESLGATNVDITGYLFIGGLAGISFNSEISNSYVTGITLGDSVVGGLVGLQESSIIKDSYMQGDVVGILTAGGLAGRQKNSTISDSHNKGRVGGTSWIGGIVGSQDDNSSIINAYNTGNISGSFHSLGGLVGSQFDSNITSSYNTGSLNGYKLIGGLAGNSFNSAVTNSYYNYEEVLINDKSIITIGALDSETYHKWINNQLCLNIDDYLANEGNSYLIDSVLDFKRLLSFGQYSEYTFKLTANLDLKEHPDFYIPFFSGSFDGNGFIIDNLSVIKPLNSNIGLFGYAFEAAIKNIGVNNVSLSGLAAVGGLVGGQGYSNISNSYSTGNVDGYQYVGGLVGSNFNSKIMNSYSTASVTGLSDFGGLVGSKEGSVIGNSYWNTETSGQSTSAGGEGRTTTEMTYPYSDNTYMDWDFNAIWAADENYKKNGGYPYLRNNIIHINTD